MLRILSLFVVCIDCFMFYFLSFIDTDTAIPLSLTLFAGFLRYLNHELDMLLPCLLESSDAAYLIASGNAPSDDKYPSPEKKLVDDFFPVITSIKCQSTASREGELIRSLRPFEGLKTRAEGGSDGLVVDRSADTQWRDGDGDDAHPSMTLTRLVASPLISTTWRTLDSSTLVSEGPGLIPISKHRVFPDIKTDNFKATIVHSAARPARTDDDYDYPDDLPTVKINRFKSFRAKEASEILGLSGEDLISASMFCQLWTELKNVPIDKLRMSYSHPMDDGQSRTFKVKGSV
jgi:hypothetical protein